MASLVAISPFVIATLPPTFWGWLFQFGSQAKVLGPERAVEMAKDAISDIADCYK